jgi:NAD-dependent dihydropyrimidine dehydrogenase PreA subunit
MTHEIFLQWIIIFVIVNLINYILLVEVSLFMAYKITDACIACGVCVDECPTDCIAAGDIYVINEEDCIDCDACAEVCPVGACVKVD